MRAFLSKILLTIFIAVFAIPSSLLAQTDWVPPTGGPTTPGTNTPAPINVGPSQQSKQGNLIINGDLTSNGNLTSNGDFKSSRASNLKGSTLFDNATGSQNNFILSFNPASFVNRVDVGSNFFGGGVGADLNIFGKLKYVPAAVGSSPAGPAPVANSVLKSADAQGNVVWGAAMPDGANTGDTLIWNTDCDCWETGPGGGGGEVPPGINNGDILVWNSTTEQWESTVNNFVDGNLPVGTEGQTLWFNSATGQWEATSMIERIVLGNDQYRRTRLRDPYVNIMGPSIVFGNSNSLISGVDPSSTLYGFTVKTNASMIQSNNVEIGKSVSSSSQYTSGQPNKTDILSNNVNFFSASSNAQNVTFESSSVKFKGPATDPTLLDAGQGRIPFSNSADGAFKWNKNLTYSEFEYLVPGFNIGMLHLANPTNSLAVFRNSGMSLLEDDVFIGENADLFLQGIGGISYAENAAGGIKHLCITPDSKRVVKCSEGLSDDNRVPDPNINPGSGTVTYTVEDNGYQHVFDFSGTVTVKYCGGGGGGGGGGIGVQTGSSNSVGQGGNGGGGGQAGNCLTESILVNPGDRLGWNIGQGGQGGYGARDESNMATTPSSNGGTGQTTSITFDPVSGPEVSVGGLASGGLGGDRGKSVYEGQLSVTAQNGNSVLANGANGWYFNGGFGRNSNGYSNDGSGSDTSCGGCGGAGGVGESRTLAGSLREPGNNPVLAGQASYRGSGGTYPVDQPMGQSSNFYNGGVGQCGIMSGGGGGGGGSFGRLVFTFTSPVIAYMNGGQGGCGGGGYVMISGLPNQTNAGEIVYSTPGTYSLTTFEENNVIPPVPDTGQDYTFTVEVWGAGGGAGGVDTTNAQVRRSGGGGSGGYRSIPMTRSQLFAATFTVGAKGANGTTGTAAGGNGGSSSVSGVSAGSAQGGRGGAGNTGSASPSAGGLGGTPLPVNYLGGTTGANGVNGGINQAPCNLAGEAISPNNGYGAGAPRTCTDGTLNVYQGSAQDGRIRISW